MGGHGSEKIATIHVQNITLRTIIGLNDWERIKKQDIIINIWIDFDVSAAVISDNIDDSLDYRSIKSAVVEKVEQSQFFLIESLAYHILQLCLLDPKIVAARVRVDKPHALRFAESVSIEISETRKL
jgi:D-erythro-7,8-dihydroneopterin triphosphate epimerase